jgi:hypothetical protein
LFCLDRAGCAGGAMIVPNGARGLIRFEEWSELEEQQGFPADLGPTQHKLQAIIGRLDFTRNE